RTPWSSGRSRFLRDLLRNRVILYPLNISKSIVPDWIDDRIDLHRILQIVAVCFPPAGCVHTVSEQNHRLSPFYLSEPVIDREVYGLVQACTSRDLGLSYRSVDRLAVARWLTQEVYFFVERNDRHSVLRAQLIDKLDRGILDVVGFELGRVAHIEDQCYRKRL